MQEGGCLLAWISRHCYFVPILNIMPILVRMLNCMAKAILHACSCKVRMIQYDCEADLVYTPICLIARRERILVKQYVI